MMDNYERTLELVNIAQDAEGASAIQFAKTLDSVATKIDLVKSSFEGIINNLVENRQVKDFLDLLNVGMQKLLALSQKGPLAFASVVGAIAYSTGALLKSLITSFSLIIAEWSKVKQKIEQPTQSQHTVNYVEANKPPILNPTTPIVDPNNPTTPAGTPPIQISPIKKAIGTAVASGIITGITVGLTSKDALAGFQTGLAVLLSQALMSPVVLAGIGKGITFIAGKIGLTALFTKIGAAIVTFAVGNVPLLVIAAVTALALGINYLFIKFNEPIEKAKRNLKELEEDVVELEKKIQTSEAEFLSTKEALKNIKELTSEYEELKNQISLSTEEQELLNENTKKLAEDYPELIAYYNASGEAVLKESILWDEILQNQREIAIEAQKKYDQDLLSLGLKNEEIRLNKILIAQEQIKKNQESVDKGTSSNVLVDTASFLFGDWGRDYVASLFFIDLSKTAETFKKEIKELEEEIELLETQGTQSIAEIDKQIQKVAANTLNLTSIVKNVSLSDLSFQIGQNAIAEELKNFDKFLREYEKSSNKIKILDEDLYQGLNENTKKYFKENIGNFLSEDKDIVSLAFANLAEIISSSFFEEIQDINLDSSQKTLNKLIEESMFMTREQIAIEIKKLYGEEYGQKIIDAIFNLEEFKTGEVAGKTLATLNGLKEQIGKSQIFPNEKLTTKSIKSFLGEENFNAFYEEWRYKGEESAKAFLEGLGYLTQGEINDILSTSNRKLEEDEYYKTGIKLGRAQIDGILATYGKDSNKILNFISTKTKSIQDILAKGDVTSLASSQELLTNLQREGNLTLEESIELVSQYATIIRNTRVVNYDSLQSTALLAESYFNLKKGSNAATKAIEALKYGTQNLTSEGLQELKKEFPELIDDIEKFLSSEDLDRVEKFQKAIADAEAAKLLKEQISFITEQYKTLGKTVDTTSEKYALATEAIANSLGNIALDTGPEFFRKPEIFKLLETAATDAGEAGKEAFRKLKVAIQEAEIDAIVKLNNIALTADQLAAVKRTIKIDGTADFSQIFWALANLGGDIEDLMTNIANLTGGKIVKTLVANSHRWNAALQDYEDEVRYTFVPGTVASTGSGSNSGGSTEAKEPKKSKVDPYINEKKSIERLENELENLKIAREESDLNPEEYAANIAKTEQLEKERINTLQTYREKLLSDQATLAAKMESSSYAGAYSINNGVLKTNVAVLQSYIDENAELADQFSDDWYETVDALESVNDKINEYNYSKDKDPYFNYTQSIENLKGQLEDLKEVRDRTDLTPEERYQNMLEIIAIDKQMVIKLKEYQAKLISDRQNLVTSFKAFDNILSISEGQLNKNTALYLKLGPEKRTEIDRLIEKYNELTGFIKENNKQLEREKELLKDLQYAEQEYQAQKIRDALAELEDERSRLDPSEQGENLAKTAVLETELSVLLTVDNENFQKEIDDIKEQLLKEEFKGAVTFTEDGGREVDYSVFAENNEDDVATLTTLKTLLDELDEAQTKQIENEKEIKNIKSTYSSNNEDQYQKETEHIEILQQKLSDLENERENGNLTAEEYNRNLSETKQTYDELETSIDNYTSSLKQDMSDIERAFAEDFSGAVKVVNGEIEYQNDIFDNLDGTVKDTLNDAIAKWRELNGIIGTNTRKVTANAQEYAKLQAALRQEYVDAYLQTEQKIISILIDRDRDILDAARKNYENMRKIDQKNMEATRKNYELMKKADEEALDQQRKNYEQLQKTEDEYVESQRKRYEELKKADQDYLEALKKNIDDRRKAREKESEYSDLASKEARLMLLKRDSSGAYANEIIELEKEIAETRQDLSDQEVDDLIAALEEQTNGRAENYDRELEALEEEYEKRKELRDAELEALEESYERKQEMLDAELDSLEAAFDAQMEWYDNEIQALEDANQAKLDSMAEYNAEADAIMKMDSESRLEWLKQNDKDFLTSTAMAQEEYIRSWTETFAKIDQLMGAYSGQLGAVSGSNAGNQNYGIVSTGPNYTTADQVAAAKNAEGKAFSNVVTSEPGHAAEMSSRDATGAMDYYYANVENDPTIDPDDKNNLYKIAAAKAAQEDRSGVTGFAKGGLVDYTGIAAVHGNPRQPEAFLSATDTKNFSIFADLLREVMGYKGYKGNGSVKASSETNNSTCNIYVTVDSIGSDYDVESAVDKIKKMMVDSASYRSVNLVTRTR